MFNANHISFNEVFDADKRTWSPFAPLPVDRAQHAACAIILDNVSDIIANSQETNQQDDITEPETVLLVSGGVESYFEDDVFPPDVLDTVLMYRLSTDTWHPMERRMPTGRTDHSMIVYQVGMMELRHAQ